VGERLRQDDLAATFGVSSTPVREALRVLEAQGLVHHEPHRGVTVADFPGNFDQLYRLREALEGLAVEMAVPRMTEQRHASLIELAERIGAASRAGDDGARDAAHRAFHLVLYEGCDFPALVDMIKMLWRRHPWDELLSLPGLASEHDHRQIAELAAARDADGAAERLRHHFRAVREALNTAIKERESDVDLVAG